MTELVLARHGRTAWNEQRRYMGWQCPGLDGVGRRQAEALASRLVGRGIDVIYSSDLQRTTETATIISRQTGLVIKPEPRLRELSFGVLEGLTFDEAQARYPERMAIWFSDPEQPLPEAEPYSVFSSRLASFVEELKLKHPEKTALIVTHGGPIREILRQALGLPWPGQWCFEIDFTSLSEITWHGAGPLLRSLNDTHHLEVMSDDG